MSNDEKRLEAVRLMKSRAGKNTYTNGGKRNQFFGVPEGANGWSDCSSAVRACIERAAGIDIGSNTDRQIRNLLAGKGKLIDAGSGGRVMPDESLLKPGDCIYFRGNTSHVKDVGHVEMYTGPNECWGHGSGQGPTKKNLKTYCANRAKQARTRYLCAVRWIPDDEDDGKPDIDEYQTITGGEWPVYAERPQEPASIGTVDAGDEVRFYGVVDGYAAIKTEDGLKGWIRKEALESAAEISEKE